MSNTTTSISESHTPSSPVPIDIKGNPISDEGVPAYLAGALYEAQQFYERIGKFKSLFEYGTISLSNGKTAIDSSESIYFASGDVSDPAKFTFLNPCPSGAERIAIYEFDATCRGRPNFEKNFAKLSLRASSNPRPYVVNTYSTYSKRAPEGTYSYSTERRNTICTRSGYAPYG